MYIKEGLDRFGDDVGQYDQEADETNEKGTLEGALTDVNQADMLDTVKTRTRKLTDKGKNYQQKVLFEKRKKPLARMMRKSKLIDDLMYPSKNLRTVEEEKQQFDAQFKLFVETHNEYVKLLPEDMHEGEENWFETIDEVVFTQKHKIYNWMKEVENDNKSVKSLRSSKNSSGRSSKGSSRFSSSNSSKNSCGRTSIEAIALEEKLKWQ